MEVKYSFGSKLKMLRDEHGLSQTQLAEELGVSRVTISYYENSERTADIDFLYKTAKFFNCSADYLLGLSEYKNRDKEINYIEISDNTNEMISELEQKEKELIQNILSKILKCFNRLHEVKCLGMLPYEYLSVIEEVIFWITGAGDQLAIISGALNDPEARYSINEKDINIFELMIRSAKDETHKDLSNYFSLICEKTIYYAKILMNDTSKSSSPQDYFDKLLQEGFTKKRKEDGD